MVAICVGVLKRGTSLGFVFVFPLLITLISASGTRTILNLQALSVDVASSSKSSDQIELTTIEDLTTWEAPWDTSTLLNEELRATTVPEDGNNRER
ncbi:hypothetical protein GYMLUDRAFT_40993 [Collybiopsis luxurians FD-317 M1]|uniref:Uncharacterized protein n=1 Tax=Collybiopsis luxurians FD-317 M1 TaxID=944289 RepID=A0A0D0D254_9AGAR|nr:hypothetical protein GYMLUDRAFT_40993 [Collybiopsis luxurians FD-317 M1]